MIHEHGVVWRKSSYSGPHDNCVTIATFSGGARAVRDSKDLTQGMIVVGSGGWSEFVAAVRGGALTSS
jgi:hypothetical protein